MRTLVLYYSYSGNTRSVAEKLARALGAEIAEITCNAYSYGLFGALRQAWDIFIHGTPPIEIPPAATSEYDLIVAAGQVWAGHPSGPIRTYVKRHALANQKMALFLTCNGTSERFSGERALSELADIAPAAPVATHLFKEADIHGPHIEAIVAAFAERLREVMAPASLAAPEAKSRPARKARAKSA